MPSVLYTASTFSHILNFHLPYLRRFRELGWQVEVACGGPVRDIPFADGAVSLPLEKKMSSPANFQAASQLRAMVTRQQYDLIITHTSLAAFFTRWALRGLKHRPKLINVVHGYLFDDETSGLKRGLLTRAETMTAPQTDLLLTMNAWDTRWAMAHRAAPRVEEIPGMGVDLTRFRTAPDARRTMRDRLGLSEGDVALLYAAEFSGRKSQHTLLEALPGLPENVKLLLPGSGALLDDCRAQAASLGVADRTVFPGQVHDMPRWLAAADIAVSSSRSEGLPFNIIEAMACGLPAVASAVKGHTDLIGPENGLLYPYGDAKAFAAAVERLVSDAALRAELGQAGREKMQRYALDAVLPQVMDRYLSVMEGKTR